MVENVLGNTGGLIKVLSIMYIAVVQAVLLYGRKIWVVTDKMVTLLEVFYHSISRRIAEITLKREIAGNGSGPWWTCH